MIEIEYFWELLSNTDLRRVKYGEDVNESFMYRREETK